MGTARPGEAEATGPVLVISWGRMLTATEPHGAEKQVVSNVAWPSQRTRPEERSMWFSFSVTYDFLATEDVNRDRIQDVLFLYKSTNSSNSFINRSCADEGNFVFIWKRRGGRRNPLTLQYLGSTGGISGNCHIALPS